MSRRAIAEVGPTYSRLASPRVLPLHGRHIWSMLSTPRVFVLFERKSCNCGRRSCLLLLPPSLRTSSTRHFGQTLPGTSRAKMTGFTGGPMMHLEISTFIDIIQLRRDAAGSSIGSCIALFPLPADIFLPRRRLGLKPANWGLLSDPALGSLLANFNAESERRWEFWTPGS